MSITASQVGELREKTGVGLMDCKKVLQETNGDLDQAIKKLREKGLAKAAKKSSRSTNEGRVFIASNTTSAVILELNCETDFVGSNNEFSKCGHELATALLNSDIMSNDSIDTLQIGDASYTDFIANYVMKLGENLTLKRFNRLSDVGYASHYVHMTGKVGALIGFDRPIDEAVAKDIAMHATATSPSYLTPADVPTTELDSERDIIRQQSLKEGKPEAIINKIVEGRLSKFYKEVCLLEQSFIKDDNQSIKELLPQDAAITSFYRYALG